MIDNTDLLATLNQLESDLNTLRLALNEHLDSLSFGVDAKLFGYDSPDWKQSVINNLCDIWYDPRANQKNIIIPKEVACEDETLKTAHRGGAVLATPELVNLIQCVNSAKMEFRQCAVAYQKQHKSQSAIDTALSGYTRDASLKSVLSSTRRARLNLLRAYKLITVFSEPLTLITWQTTAIKSTLVFDLQNPSEQAKLMAYARKLGHSDDQLSLLESSAYGGAYSLIRFIRERKAETLKINVARTKLAGYENFRTTISSPSIVICSQETLPELRWIDNQTKFNIRSKRYLDDAIHITGCWHGFHANEHHKRPERKR